MKSEDSTAYWINRTARALQRLMETRLRPFGFGPSQLPVLGALGAQAASTQSELARLANVEQPTMAKLLARMARDGLVATHAHPDDRRATTVVLTRKSRAALPKGLATLRDTEAEVLRGLSRAEQAQLRALLQRVLSNVDALNATSETGCEPRSQRA